MKSFLEDSPVGRNRGRYVEAELPALPFTTAAFRLALCSHFLFLYGTQVSQDLHVEAVRELRRVADEVRIYPLVDLSGRLSAHLDAVMRDAALRGDSATILPAPYEFQRGANQMLRIRRRA